DLIGAPQHGPRAEYNGRRERAVGAVFEERGPRQASRGQDFSGVQQFNGRHRSGLQKERATRPGEGPHRVGRTWVCAAPGDGGIAPSRARRGVQRPSSGLQKGALVSGAWWSIKNTMLLLL